MPEDLARPQGEWMWILKCRRCSTVADFEAVCVPTRQLTEWVKCCGEIMELESVQRSAGNAQSSWSERRR